MDSLVQAKKISEGIYPMIYRRGNHFMPCDPDAGNKLLFPYTYNLALICKAVLEEKLFEMVDGRTDGRRRTPDHGYTLSSHGEPMAQMI